MLESWRRKRFFLAIGLDHVHQHQHASLNAETDDHLFSGIIRRINPQHEPGLLLFPRALDPVILAGVRRLHQSGAVGLEYYQRLAAIDLTPINPGERRSVRFLGQKPGAPQHQQHCECLHDYLSGRIKSPSPCGIPW